jgi:hypothetical protein
MALIVVTVSGTTVVVGDNDVVLIDIPGGGEVTIVAEPGGDVEKVNIKFVGDSEADTLNVDLSTFSADDLQITIKNYDPTDTINLEGAFNQYVDPDNVDEFQFEYFGVGGTSYSGYVEAKDGGEKDFTADPSPIVICFVKGTEIETANGIKTIETLQIGDLVRTSDAGLIPVLWLGQSDIGGLDLRRWSNLRPVRIKANAFGQGAPYKDVVLSANHRILVSGARAELLFGESEVLVPVKSLVDGVTILNEFPYSGVSYFHLLLEGHHIVETSGLLSESLFLGDQSLLAVSEQAQEDLIATLTKADWRKQEKVTAVRPFVKAKLARCLAA